MTGLKIGHNRSSLPLSVASHHFSHKSNDHDVEPSRGRSSLTTRPIRLLNPPLLSSHRRPSSRRLPGKNPVCLCPPLTMEVRTRRDSLRQLPAPSAQAASPPVSPSQTAGALLPRVSPRFGELIPSSAPQRSNALDRPLGNSLHLSLRLPLPSCRPIIKAQAHNNQRCACLFRIRCFYVAFACYFDLICLTVF